MPSNYGSLVTVANGYGRTDLGGSQNYVITRSDNSVPSPGNYSAPAAAGSSNNNNAPARQEIAEPVDDLPF